MELPTPTTSQHNGHPWLTLFNHQLVAKLSHTDGDVILTGVQRSPQYSDELVADQVFAQLDLRNNPRRKHYTNDANGDTTNQTDNIHTTTTNDTGALPPLPAELFLFDSDAPSGRYLIAGNPVYHHGATNRCVAYTIATIREWQLKKHHPQLQSVTLSKVEIWNRRANKPSQAMIGCDGLNILCSSRHCVTEQVYKRHLRLIRDAADLREQAVSARQRIQNAKLLSTMISSGDDDHLVEDSEKLQLQSNDEKQRLLDTLEADYRAVRTQWKTAKEQLKQVEYLLERQRFPRGAQQYYAALREDLRQVMHQCANPLDDEKANYSHYNPHLYAAVHSLSTLKRALAENGPLAMLLPYFRHHVRDRFWERDLAYPNQKSTLLYCVTVVGYSDHERTIWLRNSLGPDWGEMRNGHVKLGYDEFENGIPVETYTVFYEGKLVLESLESVVVVSSSPNNTSNRLASVDTTKVEQQQPKQEDNDDEQEEQSAADSSCQSDKSDDKGDKNYNQQDDEDEDDGCCHCESSRRPPSACSSSRSRKPYDTSNNRRGNNKHSETEESEHQPSSLARRHQRSRFAPEQQEQQEEGDQGEQEEELEQYPEASSRRQSHSSLFGQESDDENAMYRRAHTRTDPKLALQELQQKSEQAINELALQMAGRTLGALDHAWNTLRPYVPCCHI
jgi:hypothetical protein